MTTPAAPKHAPRALATRLSGQLNTLGGVAAQHRAWWVGAVTLALLLAALALWVHKSVERSVKRQLAAQLSVTLDAALGAVRSEIEAALRVAEAASRAPELLLLLSTCQSEPTRCQSTPLARLAMEEQLRPHLWSGRFARARLLDTQRRTWVDLPGGGEAPRAAHGALTPKERTPRLFLPAAADEHALILAPMFFAEQKLGELSFELPLATFTKVLSVVRAGASGETYAFDGRGRLLSESRFTDALRDLGLIPRDRTSAVLLLPLRDPGMDLRQRAEPKATSARQPFTRAVSAVLRRRAFVDVDGYRDYRGVRVVGAGAWLPEFGVGLVSEVDTEEAFQGLSELDRLFASLVMVLLLMGILMVCAAIVSAQLSFRVARAEHRAEKLGQYSLGRKLGEGGMGAVYLAEHALLQRPAAIKVLIPERMTRDTRERFEREASITSKLSHPNTIAIYDHGRTRDGSLYYVMEYLDGLDLERLVDVFGPLPQERVVHLLRQLCGSLAEAHALGLVHRDVKPTNLFVCTRGGVADTLKVLDFGIVKSTTLQAGITANKVLLGTPLYMAPEMFDSSERASPQSDLYAVGAVAYFLLTGSPVFDAESTMALCKAHLTEQPAPLSARRSGPIDKELQDLITACLAKKSEARPKSALSLCAMLERLQLANRWTSANAEAWWREAGPRLLELKALAEDRTGESAPSQLTIHPLAV